MIEIAFKGKVVVITGGAGGIGRATAKMFLDAGATVVCVDLQVEQDAALPCRTIAADVANFNSVKDCVETILAEETTIDCLVNNAGISRDATIWNMTEQHWDEVLNVNLKGAYNFIHHVASHFREKEGGKIVNVSSINGLRGKFGLANYSAAKAGLIGLTKTVAKELGRYHVNVNAVAPGYVLTPLTEKLPEKIIEDAKAETVFGRLATPADVAAGILFLCSRLANHITGETIKIDGGQYI